MLHDIVDVKPLRPHKLHIKFDDGVTGEVDVAQLIKFNGIFAPLKEPKHFAEVFVNRELGTVCWPNGADLDPVVLYSVVADTSRPQSAVQPHKSVHDLLCFAIKNKRLIKFQYQDCERTAEPHDYGILEGISKLLIYQIQGESKTKSRGWKLVKADHINQLQVLDQTFPGGRAVPTEKHKQWNRLFIRVAPPSELLQRKRRHVTDILHRPKKRSATFSGKEILGAVRKSRARPSQ
jgi:hypothetical protein